MKNVSTIKSVLLLVAFTCVVFVLSSFIQERKNEWAWANKVEGYYIFSYCKPKAETEYLGTVKVPGIFSDKGGERINKLIKLVKKEYPKAEGIIISDDFSKGDAITFKNEK